MQQHRRLGRQRRWWVIQGLGILVALGACLIPTACAPGADPSGSHSTVAHATTTAHSQTQPTTESERLTALARNTFAGATVLFDTHARTLRVTGTVGGPLALTPADVARSQERVKALCFGVHQAVWTSGITLHSVTVTVLGPVLDDYADPIIGGYGTAQLDASTAARFDWASLHADSAWERYTSVWLAPAYEPNWRYGPLPSATPATS